MRAREHKTKKKLAHKRERQPWERGHKARFKVPGRRGLNHNKLWRT